MAGLFGTEPAQPAGVTASRRKNPLAAMVALTLAGLTTTTAVAATTPTDKNDDLGKEADPHHGHEGAGQHPNDPAHEVHKFDIPAGPLSEVIAAIRKQAGIRIALASQDKMADVPSQGVSGVMPVDAALRQALDGTGLAARFDAPDSVKIDVRSANESVVVTADNQPTNLKYTAPLLDLPQTVNVIGGEAMQQMAATSLVEALRAVPGITFGAGEGGNPLGDRPFIRGLDSQSSTYIDGMRDIAAQSRDTFDIDSIEVQEGPGGAYGGRGTGGGSINMNSKIARKDRFIAGSFMPGTSSYKRATIDANAKLMNSVYGRLTSMWYDAGVAGRDGVNNNRWGFAPSLAIGLGHPTRLFLDYYHLITNSIPDSGIPYNNPANTYASTYAAAGYKQVLQPGDGTPIALPYRTIFYGLLDRDKDKEYAKIGTARVEQDLFHGKSLLRNSFRYERTSQDYLWTLPDDSKGNLYYGLLFRRINAKYNSVYTLGNQTDLSGAFNTGSIKHSYAVGMEFSKERGNIDSYTNNTTAFTSPNAQGTGGTETCQLGLGAASAYNCTSLFAPNDRDQWIGASAKGVIGLTYTNSVYLAHNPSHSVAVTKSAYGFDTITLNKHFLATVGGRYDHFESSYLSSTVAKQVVVNDLGTYIAGLTYKPNAVTSIYGTVSTAAIPTGNALAQGTDTSNLSTVGNSNLQPETIRQEEFGVKRELAHGRALAHVAVYREDIQNVRITLADGNVGAAGTDRTIGLEAGVTGYITRKWDMTGGYNFIDAILTNAGGAGAANGLTNGNHMPNTPWSSFSLTSNYKIIPRLRVGGGVYANSMVWGNQSTNKWVRGYTRVDLFSSYDVNKHFSIQGNALNVGDKVYYQQAYTTHYAVLAPGRTVLVGLNVKF